MTRSVAVIGAGPGGLIAARWLLSQGFEPTIFEQGPILGGQWTGLDGRSGVWPTMHTNTSRIMTAFSDLEHESPLVYPSNRDILEYLHRYAETFSLTSRIRFGTRVELLRRNGAVWLVGHAGMVESFERVVVASGRFHAPAIPPVPGLDRFAGSSGVISTYDYRQPSKYRGKRVLVAGCAVSALEIAAELAQLGAARVVVTQRRQRYVLPKFAAGVPSDHRIFTRYGTLASETLPAAETDRQLKEIVVEAGGSPEQYGAPAPDPSLFAAGVTLNQGYLPLVAEGRITVRPWMESVADTTVTFADGHADDFDGIVLGTGFGLCLPFLSEDIRVILNLDAVHLDADRYTFHPDLPGLAFVGMWDQSGGYFVPLELQARWIAYTWGSTIPATSETDQRLSIDAYRSRRGMSQKTRMNLVALIFARAAGVEPVTLPPSATAVHDAVFVLPGTHPMHALPEEVNGYFAEMGQLAVHLGNSAQEVVLCGDPHRAAELRHEDDAMDELHRHLFTVLMDREWKHSVAAAVDVTLLGRFYERFADHAVEVGRRVIFQATGQSAGEIDNIS